MLSNELFSAVLVTMAIVQKAPIVYRVLKNKSVMSISSDAVFYEMGLQTFNIGYNIFRGNNPTMYAETCTFLLQNTLIMWLMIRYDAKEAPRTKKLLAIWACVAVLQICQLMPSQLYQIQIFITMGLLIRSRVPQLLLIRANQSTGQLSIITYISALTGAFIRVYTILLNTKDLLMLLFYFIAIVTNSIIFCTFFIYPSQKSPTKKD